MNERDLAVLDQYELTVGETHRGRGFYICVTDQGKKLLQEYHGSEKKARLQQLLLRQLAESGYPNVDIPVANREGAVVTRDKDGGCFILKNWVEGRECDVFRQEELKSSAANLARLHRLMFLPEEEEQEEEAPGQEADAGFAGVARRRNKELKKVRSFVRGKKNKTDFELYFLQYFPVFFEKGLAVQEELAKDEYRELYLQARRQKQYRHGEYTHHNVLFSSQGIGTVNFEHYTRDVQLEDLVQFMRKILEKYDWDLELGRGLWEAYSRIRPLTDTERRYLAYRLAYPEKFWKLSNRYYNVNKAWICGRNTSKLVRLAVQETNKENFIRRLADNQI